MKPSRSEYHDVRGLRLHVRRWGDPQAPVLLMLHGHMDVSASFQFVVDALRHEWQVVAPDWRGHGESAWRGHVYWASEYLADLHMLWPHLCGDRPAHVVAHSMGAYVSGLYAGIHPERVATLTNLDGYVLLENRAGASVQRHYARWLDTVKAARPPSMYASLEEFERRLVEGNPRLPTDRAAFLARHYTRRRPDGRFELLMDPIHRTPRPVSVGVEDFLAARRATTAPVLCVGGTESDIFTAFADRPQVKEAQMACFRNAREVVLEGVGHNIHHEQPERAAALIEEHVLAACAP